MNRKQYTILVVLLDVFLILITVAAFVIYDFYKDYKCSTTTDINWFIENNCLEYTNDQTS